jgi:hypothetical protein
LTILKVLALSLTLIVIAFAARGFSTPGQLKAMPRGAGAVLGYHLGRGDELDALGAVWYHDYQFATANWSGHPRLYFAQVSDDLQRVARVARQSRGQWWTLGNEPNDPNQDNLTPDAYARVYHDFYFALKLADPQARVVPAGVANADWHWLDAWREKYREAYGRYPLLDAWNFHNYILDSCAAARNVAEFERRVLEFRAWMKRIGDEALPLIITEYGVLYGNGCCNCPTVPVGATIDYMRTTTRWLTESRAVDAWAWFAVDTGNRYEGDLFWNGKISPYGEAYRELVQDSMRR